MAGEQVRQPAAGPNQIGQSMSLPSDHCMVCGGTDIRVLYEVTDTNEGIPGRWAIAGCRACGLGVLVPFPAPDTVASFYRNQFYNEEGERFRGWVERVRYMLARFRGATLNRHAPSRGKLLDFGSGAGHFAKAQTAAGWQVVALDPYSAAATDAARSHVVGDSVELLFPDEAFDAVTLWYVIEHVSNPRLLLTEFHRVLKPGGILVLAQQDFSSIQARLFGPRWLILDPPRHLWQFTESNLSRLVSEAGFSPFATDRASIEMGPFTILQSTLNYLVGNGNYLFKFLKSKKLPSRTGADNEPLWGLITSFVLLPALVPISLIAYYIFLAVKSGDSFTLYSRRQ